MFVRFQLNEYWIELPCFAMPDLVRVCLNGVFSIRRPFCHQEFQDTRSTKQNARITCEPQQSSLKRGLAEEI